MRLRRKCTDSRCLLPNPCSLPLLPLQLPDGDFTIQILHEPAEPLPKKEEDPAKSQKAPSRKSKRSSQYGEQDTTRHAPRHPRSPHPQNASLKIA